MGTKNDDQQASGRKANQRGWVVWLRSDDVYQICTDRDAGVPCYDTSRDSRGNWAVAGVKCYNVWVLLIAQAVPHSSLPPSGGLLG